jgi:hypothetical protein
LWDGNTFIISRLKTGKESKGSPIYYSKNLIDGQVISVNPSAIPFRVKEKADPLIDMFSTGQSIQSNLSDIARAYLAKLSINNPDGDDELEQGTRPYELIWFHALAIGYSPAYLSENKDSIQGDWPRIPLPASRSVLVESAVLGKQVATLLDTESQIPDVLNTPEISHIATLCRADGKQINPQQGDLALTAGWGHAQGNIVMPGQGKTAAHGKMLDIYLNNNVYWQDIPQAVWEYVIGGYQVVKKWLSYREQNILGRDMTVKEAREVTNIVRRIAALLALEKTLDENYKRVKQETIKLQ